MTVRVSPVNLPVNLLNSVSQLADGAPLHANLRWRLYCVCKHTNVPCVGSACSIPAQVAQLLGGN